MTNDELKKKIIRVLQSVEFVTEKGWCGQCISLRLDYSAIADALIAAGIGFKDKHRVFVENVTLPKNGDCDAFFVPNTPIKITQLYGDEEVEKIVKERDEYKHRAEVAEKALRNAAPRLKCRGGLGEGFCGVDKCDYYHCNNDEGCVKAHLQQAEKELAEEKK